jgi:hypothetical protein
MHLIEEDFNLLKSNQYCDNLECSHYQKVGKGNLKIYSRKTNQIYCNGSCSGRPFVVTKGTIFYGLKTPLAKVVETLSILASGMGVNNTCREQGVTADSILDWLVKAGNHVSELTIYMEQHMHFDQVQIDEFWSYVLKKRKI